MSEQQSNGSPQAVVGAVLAALFVVAAFVMIGSGHYHVSKYGPGPGAEYAEKRDAERAQFDARCRAGKGYIVKEPTSPVRYACVVKGEALERWPVD